MSLPNQLIVSGATNFPVANGTYTKGADVNNYPAWYKDDAYISFTDSGETNAIASIRPLDNSTVYYQILQAKSETWPGSPVGVSFTLPWGAPGGITIEAGASAPSTVTFPSSPTLNQSFTAGSRTWVFNGTAWKLQPKTTDAITEGSTNKYYTDARVAAAPAVTALESRAGTIESAATSLEGRVSTAEGSITTLTSGLATEKGRVDAILLAADADKDSFAEIVQLINSVDTANDTAFGAYVTSNNAAVSAIEGRVTTAEGDIDALEGRATSIESAATSLTTRVSTAEGTLSTHVAATDNPHSVTKTQVGLSNVDNTSDANKPVSTAQQAAIDTKQDKNVLSATAPSHVEGLVWIDTTDMSQYVSYAGVWVELDQA